MSEAPSPAAIPPPGGVEGNLRRFLLFRVLFNCRFYYPVYAILFLDFGLTLKEFAILNAAWALTIVVLEIPSGALADQFGRRALVVASGVFMVLEMLVLCLAPVGGGTLLFWMFMANRILSGAAEAAASGADEALAYDSIPAGSREPVWARTTSKLITWQSVGFIVATVSGAIVYDPDRMTAIARFLGFDGTLDQSQTVKYPLYLTFLSALATLWVALRFVEPAPHPGHAPAAHALRFLARVGAIFRRTVEAGGWILRSPAPLMLILIGVLFDSIVRLFYTVGSQYYRLLQIDPEWYGWIGAAGSLVGIGTAVVVERLYARFSAATNFGLAAILVLAGLASLAFPIPYWGVVLIIPLWVAMRFTHYFLSQYLNRVTDSARRATVLSFKGIALNLGYFTTTLLFGVQTSYLSHRLFGTAEENLAEPEQNRVFAEAISLWPWYFAATLAAAYLFMRLRYRQGLNAIIAPPAAAVTP
ncbi:MFS transporter [soil metagenome]